MNINIKNTDIIEDDNKNFILEVQQFTETKPGVNNGFKHIGYMDILFINKKEACLYYDKYHKQMRSLNAHKTWRSDWNSETKLRYIVREYNYEIMKIKPFGEYKTINNINYVK